MRYKSKSTQKRNILDLDGNDLNRELMKIVMAQAQNRKRPWTKKDEYVLGYLRARGVPYREIAKVLHRANHALRQHVHDAKEKKEEKAEWQ